MKVKGFKKGKLSTKRMASLPRWRKTRPEARNLHHLSPFERLALLSSRRRRKQPGPVAAADLSPATEALPSPDLAPSPLAERLIAWSKGALRGSVSALNRLSDRLAGLMPQSGPLGTALRILASPFTGLRDGLRNAFAPVMGEGDRSRGTAAFHGTQRDTAAPAAAILPEDKARAIIAAAMADLPDKGDPELPADLSTLAILVGDSPPRNDFKASDMVRDCFAAQGVAGLQSRALLAVAIRLSQEFGLPTRLPLAADRAWRMLDPVTFEDEMATELAAIRAFISDWQKTQQNFLVLEFAEIELIEWLFESLHPGRHSDLLFEVMNFKVLSNRRQGILRRIPHRVRKFVKDSGGGHEAVLYAAGTHAYLNRIVTTHGFTPIVDTATASLEEVTKVLEKLKPAALPGPAGEGDGQALARINPIKMPASELADRAIAAAHTPAAAPVAPAALQSPLLPPAPPRQAAAPVAPQPLSIQPLPPQPAASASAPVGPAPARPAQLPAAMAPQPAPQPVGGIRPATTRLQPKHIRAGAVLTIPSRSAGRIPLGRMFSVDAESTPAASAITVSGGLTRPPSRPKQLPGRINAFIPTGLAHLALPAPAAQAQLPAPAAAPEPPRAVTGRINLALPGRPAPSAAPQAAPPPAPAAVIKPQPAPQAPVALADTASTAARGDNVTKLTMVQKRRLPITQALKRQSVMRVLRGEDAEAVAQTIGISRTKLDEWVDKFIAAGAGALTTSRKRKSEELTVDTLRTKLAEVLATAQLIEQVMEASLPRRPLQLAAPQETGTEAPPHRPKKKRG